MSLDCQPTDKGAIALMSGIGLSKSCREKLGTMMNQLDTHPHNIPAEQAVIGSLLHDNSFIVRLPQLTAEHFYLSLIHI